MKLEDLGIPGWFTDVVARYDESIAD